MALLPGAFREELNILVVVDLDEGDAIGAILSLQREGFGVSKKVPIKGACSLKIADIKRHVGHPKNVRRTLSEGGAGLTGAS
jgi:hypothetical protein